MSQTLDEACDRFTAWLDSQVSAAATGSASDYLEVAPASTFWLGRLASEEDVRNNVLGDRAERLDPCAIGIRVRPAGPAPWRFTADVSMRAWVKEDEAIREHADKPWRRLSEVTATVPVVVEGSINS